MRSRRAGRMGLMFGALLLATVGCLGPALRAEELRIGDAGATATGAAGPFRLLELGGRTVSWRGAVPGQALVVTYRMLDAPAQFADARNCASMLPAEAAIEASGLSLAALRKEVRAAFDMWSAVTAVVFRETTGGQDADIVIGAQAEPRGRAFTNVATRDADAHQIRQSLICLNPATGWKIGFDGNLDVYDLRYTLAHEIGHAIGLDHPGRDGQLMSYRYSEARRTLATGDVAGAVALYGAPGAAQSAAVEAVSRPEGIDTGHSLGRALAPRD